MCAAIRDSAEDTIVYVGCGQPYICHLNSHCHSTVHLRSGKSSESVQCAMLKACDACADMGQL